MNAGDEMVRGLRDVLDRLRISAFGWLRDRADGLAGEAS